MMRTRTAMALGASLTLATAQIAWAQAAPEAAPPPREGMAMPHPAGNDPIANEGVIEDSAVDALKEMSTYLMQAKTPEESKAEWDLAKIVATIPGDQAFRPLSEGGCPLVKK